MGELPPSGISSTPLGAVLVYSANASSTSTPIRTLQGSNTSLFSPITLASDSVGNLYVASPGQDIVEFASGADGNATPVRRLTGPFAKNTGITAALSMGVDSSGNLYVVNDAGNGVNNVLIFAPTQFGDVAPIRTIAGANTLLNGNSFGSVFDSAGNLYVVTESVSPAYAGILEFSPTATGNVAPIRVISGSNTTLSGSHVTNPVLDSAGNIYVIVASSGSTPKLVKFAANASGNALPIAITPSGTTIDSFAITWR